MIHPSSWHPAGPQEFIGLAARHAAELDAKIQRLQHTPPAALPVVKWLFHGPGGTGKSDLALLLARRLTLEDGVALDSPTGRQQAAFNVEHLNGQSLNVDLVRQWEAGAVFKPMFGARQVKLIDEIDSASEAALRELRTYLDKLTPSLAVLATTNRDVNQITEEEEPLLYTVQRRFIPYACPRVPGPDIARLLRRHWPDIPEEEAARIAAASEGCVASALLDAERWLDRHAA